METKASAGNFSILRKSPLATDLRKLADALPIEELAYKLQKRDGRGPKGYPARSLLLTFAASFFLNHDSIADTVRSQQDNPALALACELDPRAIPSRPTLSRFFQRLSDHPDDLLKLVGELTDRLHGLLPGFGNHLAVDATHVRSHSNPDSQPVSDPDASFIVKGHKVGGNQKQAIWGMKLFLAVDATYELPVAAIVTTGSAAESLNLKPLLAEAASRNPWFSPKSVTADKGFDALHVYETITEDYGAKPIIPIRAMRTGAKKRRKNSELRTDIDRKSTEFKCLLAGRTSVERAFGLLKSTRRLERHQMRTLPKLTAHCLLSVAVMQARAVAQALDGGPIRECVRKVA